MPTLPVTPLPHQVISSRKHRWLKDIRRLLRSKDEGRWLLEGPHLLSDAVDAGIELEATLATRDFLSSRDTSAESAALLARLPRPPLEVDVRLLAELADADSPQGIVAIARHPPCRLADVPLAPQKDGVYVFADGLQDPGNLGALARVAEATGARALAVGPGSCRLEHPRALRASAGSLLRLPAVARATVQGLDERLADGGSGTAPRWLVLVPRDGTDLYSADLGGCLVLAVGGEGQGPGEAVARRADVRLTIPMAGSVESLNATVAAAVALFEIARRRR